MYKPFNAVTGKFYQGNNVAILTEAAASKNTNDPRWLTFLQAKEHGWKVRKGEKGTAILVAKEIKTASDIEAEKLARPGEILLKKPRTFCKRYVVFNATQIDGITAFDETITAEATAQSVQTQLSLF